jgi:CDP-diacylglycerol pyrophosphatase
VLSKKTLTFAYEHELAISSKHDRNQGLYLRISCLMPDPKKVLDKYNTDGYSIEEERLSF